MPRRAAPPTCRSATSDPAVSHYAIWSWTPGEDVPRIPFHGRGCLRGRRYPALPASIEWLADGPAGSGIYSQPPIAGYAPSGVCLRYPDGHVIGYALSAARSSLRDAGDPLGIPDADPGPHNSQMPGSR